MTTTQRRNSLARLVCKAAEKIDRGGIHDRKDVANLMHLALALNDWIVRMESVSTKVHTANRDAKRQSVLHLLTAANRFESGSSVSEEIMRDISAIGREICSAYTKEGIERARARGQRIGRPRKRGTEFGIEVERLYLEGISKRRIAKMLGAPCVTVRRHLKNAATVTATPIK